MDIKGIRKVFQVQSKIIKNNLAPNVSDNKTNPKNSHITDKVQISSQGSFHAKLQAETKKYAAQVQTDTAIRSNRIAELKLKYQGDECPVTGVDVARALLENVCGSTKSKD